MSLKVLRGFRFKESTFERILTGMRDVSAAITQDSRERMLRFVITRAVEMVDRNFLRVASGESAEQNAPLFAADTEMRERQKVARADCTRDPDIDYEVVISIWRIEPEGWYIGQVVAEDCGGAYDRILKSGVAEDFYFTDQVPPEDGISKTEWNLRRRLWNEVIKKRYEPPVTIRLSPDSLYRRDELAPFTPSYESRCAQLAESLLYGRWVRERNLTETFELTAAWSEMHRALRGDRDTLTQLAHQLSRAKAILPSDPAPFLVTCRPELTEVQLAVFNEEAA